MTIKRIPEDFFKRLIQEQTFMSNLKTVKKERIASCDSGLDYKLF